MTPTSFISIFKDVEVSDQEARVQAEALQQIAKMKVIAHDHLDLKFEPLWAKMELLETSFEELRKTVDKEIFPMQCRLKSRLDVLDAQISAKGKSENIL